MKRYRWLIGVAISVLIVILGFVIQVEFGPDGEERIIVDYTLNLYSAPDCFNEAGFTNNIGETTYSEIEADSSFTPESSCTAYEFRVSRGPLWLAWFM